MSKTNTKKMLTVMITVAMVFSALAILSFAATPAYAASGTFTANPTAFVEVSGSGLSATMVVFNGGTFGSTATLYFYISKTNTFVTDALLTTSPTTVKLPAGSTTMSNLAVVLSGGSAVVTGAGTYYLAVSDDAGATLTSAVTVTVFASTAINPAIQITVGGSVPSSVTPGETVTVSSTSSHSFESGSTISIYLNYAGGTSLLSSVSESALASGVSMTIPENIPGSSTGTTYYVVAQESSSSSTYYGVTAYTSFSLKPTITVSPTSISGAASSTFSVTGYGFPASDTFSTSTQLNQVDTIQLAAGSTDTIVSSFSSSSTGAFTASVTGLANSISTYGPTDISVTDSGGTTFSDVGSIIVSVPNPAALGFNFEITPTYPLTSPNVYVNDSATPTVWNFPAGQTVVFDLGSTEVASVTTDSNGAGSVNTVIPAIPANSYTPTAVDTSGNLVVTSSGSSPSVSSVTVTASWQAVDPSGAALISANTEYVPSSGNITIQAYGLTPTTTSYDFYDSEVAASPNGVGASSLVTSVMVGSESSSTGKFTPAANGTLIFSYSPGYASLSSPPSTSTPITITSANSVSEYGYTSTNNYKYYAIGSITFTTPTLSTSSDALLAGHSGYTLSISGIIPDTATLYPGLTDSYNAYIGNTELTLTLTSASGTTTGTAFTSADTTIKYQALSSSGVYDFNITYSGQSVSSSVGTQTIVISSPGSSGSSGNLALVATTNGWTIVGYGYDTSLTSFTFYYMTSTGLGSSTGVSESLDSTTGAFIASSGSPDPLATTPTEPAGTYSVFTQGALSGTTYTVYSSYTISTNVTLSAYHGNVGQTITISSTAGLVGTTNYGVYFGATKLLSATGAALASNTFTVPTVVAGKYTVSVTPLGSSTAAATAGFQVKANSAITLGTSSQYAFPGQLVTFSVTGFSLASPLNIALPGPTEYFAQISFNGTLVATVPASFSSGTLSGSFINPNNAPGSYYEITFGGYLQASALTSSGGSITTGTIAQVALTNSGSTSDFFGLVSGNGALLTGITSSEIATIEADINSTVSTSLTVPISQLNAAITSINGAVATLKTTVGNITTDLSTINATVASISSGQALVLTDLGSISTSLASLNASLVAFNNNVVTINTTLGQVVTSLGSIQTQVKANANGIATVTTAVGTVQGQIVSQNGNITTVKTSLGTLTANVSKVQSQTSGFPTLEIFLIVIIVLVLITLVISFLAVNAANKAARRATEEKKQ